MIMSIALVNRVNWTDADFGWQNKAGAYMVEHQQILSDDVFSWLNQNQKTTWYNMEWLSEIVMHLCSGTVLTYYLLTIVITMVILLCTYWLIRDNLTKLNAGSTVGFMFLTFSALIFICMRPYMFALLFFALELGVFEKLYRNPNSKAVYILPFLSILWMNMHGGSAVLFYIVAAIYVISGLFNFTWFSIIGIKRRDNHFYKQVVIIAISGLCMLINPYGAQLLKYPYVNMFDRQMTSYIIEWRCPSIKNWPDIIVYVVIVLIIGFIFIQREKLIELKDLLLAVFFIGITLVSIRHYMFLWIVAFLLISKYMPSRKQEQRKGYYKLAIYLWIFVDVLLISCQLTTPVTYQTAISAEMISSIKEYEPKRLYNSYDMGGMLIYHDIPVFIDGRYELYAKYTFEDYYTIYHMKDGAVDMIESYQFDAFLIDHGSSIDYYLKRNDQYRLLKTDEISGTNLYVPINQSKITGG